MSNNIGRSAVYILMRAYGGTHRDMECPNTIFTRVSQDGMIRHAVGLFWGKDNIAPDYHKYLIRHASWDALEDKLLEKKVDVYFDTLYDALTHLVAHQLVPFEKLPITYKQVYCEAMSHKGRGGLKRREVSLFGEQTLLCRHCGMAVGEAKWSPPKNLLE